MRLVPVIDDDYLYVQCEPDTRVEEILEWLKTQDFDAVFGAADEHWMYYFAENEIMGVRLVEEGVFRWIPAPGSDYASMLYPSKAGCGAFFVKVVEPEAKVDVQLELINTIATPLHTDMTWS